MEMKKYLCSCSSVLLLFLANSASALEADDYLRLLSPPQGDARPVPLHTRGITGETVRLETPEPAAESQPEVAMHLQFELNSATLTPQSEKELQKLVTALNNKSLRDYKFKIEGHTCDRGRASYNLSLSNKRAQNVADFLVNNSSLGAEQFEVAGYGESTPVVPNRDEQSRRKNRRVVIRNTLATVANTSDLPETTSSVAMQIHRYGAEQHSPLQRGEALTSGDHYAVTFTPGTHRYAYLCQIDSAGTVNLLFPDLSAKKNPVAPQTTYRVPAEGEYLTLDTTVGKEQLLLLTFDSRIANPKQACLSALKKGDSSEGKYRGLGGVTSSTASQPAAITSRQENTFMLETSCSGTQQVKTRGVAGIKEISTAQNSVDDTCQGTVLEHYFLHK